MGLREAVTFLSGAVDRKTTNIGVPTYMFHNGWAYVRAPSLVAGHPVPEIVDSLFGLSAEELDASLGRLRGDFRIAPAPGSMVLSGTRLGPDGRRIGTLQSTIKLLLDITIDSIPGRPDTSSFLPVPPTLMAGLAKALPYTSAQRTNWTSSVLVEEGRVLATNGREGVSVDVPGLAPPVVAALTDVTVGYLVSLDPPPTSWLPSEGSVTFSWPSEAFVRCQVLPEPWSEAAFRVFDRMTQIPTLVPIERDLGEIIADLAHLNDGHLDLTPTGVAGVGKAQKAQHEIVEVEHYLGDIPALSRWRIDALQRLVATATHWAPSADELCPFSAPGVRGFIGPLRMR